MKQRLGHVPGHLVLIVAKFTVTETINSMLEMYFQCNTPSERLGQVLIVAKYH